MTAQASSSTKVCAVPVPPRTPAVVTEPAHKIIKLEPRPAICSLTFACAPLPTATITITAPTPMMMPSIVKPERNLLILSA